MTETMKQFLEWMSKQEKEVGEKLAKMEKVRNFLLDERIVDKDSFEDYKNNL